MKAMRVTAEVLNAAGCSSHWVRKFGKKWPRGLALCLANAGRMDKARIMPCRFIKALTERGQDLHGDLWEGDQTCDTWMLSARDFLTCVRKGHLRAEVRRMMEAAAVEYRKGKGGR